MPDKMEIGVFVLGGFLLAIAIAGGNFTLFGTGVSKKVESPALRWLSGVMGMGFIAASFLGYLGILPHPDAGQPSQRGASVGPALAAVGNELFILSQDKYSGMLYYTHGVVGHFADWRAFGMSLATDHSPATTASGSKVYLSIRARDGHLYLTHAVVGGEFETWKSLQFQSDTSPALCSSAGVLSVFSVKPDGSVWTTLLSSDDASPKWTLVPGLESFTAPAAGAVGTYLYVTARDSNSKIFLNQGDLGHTFVGWLPLNKESAVPQAVADLDNDIYFFVTRADGRVEFTRAPKGGVAQDWRVVGGTVSTASSPAAASLGDKIFVAISGSDGELYLNEAPAAGTFGDAWIPLEFKRS